MAKPVLAVDFDDVVASFNQSFALYHNKYFGTSVRYEEIYTYRLEDIYQAEEAVFHGRVMDFSHHHHDTLEPLARAIDSLSKLQKRYRLEIVTSRCESIREITLGWVRKHAFGLFSDAHFTNSYGTKYPERRRTKLEVCTSVGAVALIDDAASHANEVAAAGIPAFLPTRPWNKDVELVKGVTRVNGWDEIVAELLS